MTEPERGELTDQLFWRDEVLQAMYWMQGEGLGTVLSVATLVRLLDATHEHLLGVLERMVDDGYLDRVDPDSGEYRLTEMGTEVGKRSFGDEFADLTRAAHGACAPDCDCHRHPSLAAACRAERSA